MPFSARYHLRGNTTDNPAHLRTMALQFADHMLQPPIYPPLSGNRIRDDETNRFLESLPKLERQRKIPSSRPGHGFKLPRPGAPNNFLRVSHWLHRVERATGHRSNVPIDTLKWLNERARGDRSPDSDDLRVSQWVQGVEDARGDWQRAQQKSHRQRDRDAAAKAASAKMSAIRDSLQSALQSMQPTLEVVRERHAALLASLSNGPPMRQADLPSGQTEWEVDWEDPVSVNNEELDYLHSLVESEWYNNGETH